nr:DUF3073 domain-containing protein [Corynebacterium lactis]
MGRGRAKAKQAKVARQLKYDSPEMDLERLQRELVGKSDESDREDDYSDWEEWASGADHDR